MIYVKNFGQRMWACNEKKIKFWRAIAERSKMMAMPGTKPNVYILKEK